MKNNKTNKFTEQLDDLLDNELFNENGHSQGLRTLTFTDKESYHTLMDEQLTFPENVEEMYKRFIKLPDEKLLLPCLISYLFIPSALCNVLPICACIGLSGSGKSETGKFAANLHNTKPLQATSTFAALRNKINNTRFPHLEQYKDLMESDKEQYNQLRFSENNEKNIMLIWEDIEPKFFKKYEYLYSLFKSGFSLSTELTEIADRNGTNVSFRTFSPKIISSIHNLYADSELNELQRRLLVIPHKRLEFLGNFEPLNIDDYSWKGINYLFKDFWNNRDNSMGLIKLRNKLKRPKEFTAPQWQVTRDLMAIGFTIKLFDNLDDIYNHWLDYWDYFEQLCSNNKSPIDELLDDWILMKEKENAKIKEDKDLLSFLSDKTELQTDNLPLSQKELKQAVDTWTSLGIIERIDIIRIHQLMLARNYVNKATGYYKAK